MTHAIEPAQDGGYRHLDYLEMRRRAGLPVSKQEWEIYERECAYCGSPLEEDKGVLCETLCDEHELFCDSECARLDFEDRDPYVRYGVREGWFV
jgi:hypothetical protein